MATKPKDDSDHPEEKSTVTLPGTVEKIIPSVDSSEPDKAQIAVEGAEPLYKEIRIDNALQNNDGEKVSLKPGADVEVTITAEPEATEKAKAAKLPFE
jgi:hypothetical protein